MAVLDRLMRDGAPQTPQHHAQREASIAMLAATIVRGGEEESVQALFARLADERGASWQRAALMRGGEIALLGATMPGTPAPAAPLPRRIPRRRARRVRAAARGPAVRTPMRDRQPPRRPAVPRRRCD